jgi:hypothetical protein
MILFLVYDPKVERPHNPHDDESQLQKRLLSCCKKLIGGLPHRNFCEGAACPREAQRSPGYRYKSVRHTRPRASGFPLLSLAEFTAK